MMMMMMMMMVMSIMFRMPIMRMGIEIRRK